MRFTDPGFIGGKEVFCKGKISTRACNAVAAVLSKHQLPNSVNSFQHLELRWIKRTKNCGKKTTKEILEFAKSWGFELTVGCPACGGGQQHLKHVG